MIFVWRKEAREMGLRVVEEEVSNYKEWGVESLSFMTKFL